MFMGMDSDSCLVPISIASVFSPFTDSVEVCFVLSFFLFFKCLNNSQKRFSEECTWMFWVKMLLKSWVVSIEVVIQVATIMLEAKGVVVQIRRWTGQALGQNLEEHNWRVWQDGMRSPHNSTPQSTVAWQLWMNISWWVACDCECVSPKGSHTMPGQHSQTRLLLVQGCMHIYL